MFTIISKEVDLFADDFISEELTELTAQEVLQLQTFGYCMSRKEIEEVRKSKPELVNRYEKWLLAI